MALNLKSRIGEALQVRSAGSAGDAQDSESLALKRRQQDEAQKLYMRRLLVRRNRELDELRVIMSRRQNSPQSTKDNGRHKGGAPTRPPGLTDGAQLVSLINELEVKVLSEPMGLTGLPPLQDPLPVDVVRDKGWRSHSGSSTAHPMDDVALMVAAQRWGHAADLLIKAIHAGDVPRGTDWATRCAIDLLERSGQTERVAAMRLQYLKTRGREPGRIVPPKLSAAVSGRVQVGAPVAWTCPADIDSQVPVAMGALLASGNAGVPVVIDWTHVVSIDEGAVAVLHACFEQALSSRNVFVHLGLPTLIRVVQQALRKQAQSHEAWSLWLTLLNWTGFRHAHRSAVTAYAREFQQAPAQGSVRCVSQPLSLPAGGVTSDLVCAARFQGELTREHVEELDRLEGRAAMAGRLVILDLRMLASLDFFFGADLLNWAIRRHSRGETVAVAYAHPLLAHFLQMLGLHQYAKLHGPSLVHTSS
ncbi:MAG: STAS domain-containing protein [Hydrogenophaga sp.]|uniref:STAS domain-containing protein n=1 Tax=Hydrogenophaga sp. TaxID=1904254 RepID=UPI003D0E95CC